ncbi:MAG: SDR family oxidoreductase, partial [Candidatus Dormibacteraeota bacterium]|nr:SDR family oxidoreductase [Candidatus Dormibacteraeota bacterium]
GLAMAKALAEAGAAVVIAGRSVDKNERAVAEIEAAGNGHVISLVADLLQEDSATRLVREAVAEFGRLDILVNNAGINIRKRPEDYTLEEWHSVLDSNLTSAFLCAKAAYPHLKRNGGGKVISVGSMTTLFGGSHLAPYSASKGGIVQLTRSLAVAWAPDNVQVNAILPGWIDTALTERARAEIPGLNERILARTPAARWGVPVDLAGIAVFLASGGSDFITGAAIPVDGGYSASM